MAGAVVTVLGLDPVSARNTAVPNCALRGTVVSVRRCRAKQKREKQVSLSNETAQEASSS
jgi:hypothetical protein